MWKDPIVEEVRRVREQLLEECGFDLRKVMERMMAAEHLYGDRSVTPEELRERRHAMETAKPKAG